MSGFEIKGSVYLDKNFLGMNYFEGEFYAWKSPACLCYQTKYVLFEDILIE